MFFTLAGVGCGAAPEEDLSRRQYLRTDVARIDSLVSEQIGPTDLLGNPWMIAANERVIVVSDLEPPYLHVLNGVTGEHIKSFGITGEGPGDFAGAPSLLRAGMTTDTLWVLDGPRRRLTGFGIRELASHTLAPEPSTFSFDSVLVYTADGPDREGGFVGMAQGWQGQLTPVRLRRGNPKPQILKEREIVDGRLSPRYKGNAYLGRVCLSSQRNVTVQTFSFAGRLDFLDGAGAMIRTAKTPYSFRPDPYADTTAPEPIDFNPFLPRVRWAYYDCAVSDNFLYALYDGRLTGADPGNAVPYGEIHVFDWEGALVRTLVLDHPTTGIAVLPGDTLLVSFAEDSGQFAVRRTRLPRR
jgi:hypothetical protein